MRPDLVISSEEAKRMVIVELTVPYESRIPDSHEFKIAKYEELCKEVRRAGFRVDFFAVEVGTRGFLANSVLRFGRWLGLSAAKRKAWMRKLSREAEKASFWIWCRRGVASWAS